MSSPIKVTFAALHDAQGDISASAQRIFGQLDELKASLAPMVATWEGEAYEAYAEKQRRWDTAAADLSTVLMQIGRVVGDANANYQQTERANAARWR